jgi:hypothetical protein
MIDKVSHQLGQLGDYIKHICQDSEVVCRRFFEQIDAWNDYRPVRPNLFAQQVKVRVDEKVESVLETAQKELNIQDKKVISHLRSQCIQESQQRYQKMILDNFYQMDQNILLDKIEETAQQVCQGLILLFFRKLITNNAQVSS